jgi:hypothetical protein
VFVGKVVSRSLEASSPGGATEAKDGKIYVQLPSGFFYRTRIAVEKVFRGKVGTEVEFIDTRNDCSISFEVNELYLIFADSEKSKQSAPTRCTLTDRLANATAEVEYLSALQKGKEEGFIQGYIRRSGNSKREKSADQEKPFEGILVVAEGSGGRHEVTPHPSGGFAIALPLGEYQIWLERKGGIVNGFVTTVKVGNQECSRSELVF